MIARIFNIVDYLNSPMSVDGVDDVSLTIPGQAIDLRTVIRKLSNGESVPTISMMYDMEPSFDDVDLSDIDPRHVTPNMLKVNFGVGVDPKSNDPKPNDPKSNDPKPNDPKSNDPKSNDPVVN